MTNEYKIIKNMLKNNASKGAEQIEFSNQIIKNKAEKLYSEEKDNQRCFKIKQKEEEYYNCKKINGFDPEVFRTDIVENLIFKPSLKLHHKTNNKNVLKMVAGGEHIISYSGGGKTNQENCAILANEVNKAKKDIPLYDMGKNTRQNYNKNYGINPKEFLDNFNKNPKQLCKDFDLNIVKNKNGELTIDSIGYKEEPTVDIIMTTDDEQNIIETLLPENKDVIISTIVVAGSVILVKYLYDKYRKYQIKKKLECPPKYFNNIQEYTEFIMKNKLTTEEYGTFRPFDNDKYSSFEEERKFYT